MIKTSSFLIFSLCMTAIRIPYLSQTTNNILRLFFEILSFLFLYRLKGFTKTICRKNRTIIFYWGVMTFCTAINTGISSRTLNALITGLEYVLFFLGISFFIPNYGILSLRKHLIRMVGILVLLADVCVLITNGGGIGGTSVLPYYIMGNKFTTSYINMFFLALLMIHEKRNLPQERDINIIIISLTGFIMFICHKVDCNTGLIGSMILGLLYIINMRKNFSVKILNNSKIFLILITGMTFLLVGTNIFFNNSLIQKIVVQVLHRKMTLTGRREMYRLVLQAFRQKYILGYGINSTYIQDVLKWGNAQNGLLKIMLDYGSVGVLSFFLVINHVFHKPLNRKIENKDYIYPMIYFLYSMAICSLVEINLTSWFFFGLAIVNAENDYGGIIIDE